MAFGETFLHYPDLFPTRRSGESWGDERLDIDFVGGPYRFVGLAPKQVEATRERFGALCLQTREGPAAVETRLFRVGSGEFRSFSLAGWDYTFDRDYTAGAVRLAGFDFLGRLDWRPELAGSLWTHVQEGAAFQCLFENYFRVLVAYRLAESGGVLLHSAGVASQGRGHLFFGRSGAGKTTLSRLALESGRLVLSDDMNAICPGADEELRIEKLPFAGDLGRMPGPRSSYPLASLNRIRQGPNRVRPLATAEAVAALIACCPFVNCDPHRLDVLVSNLRALAQTAGAQELTFSLEGDFWNLLEPEAAVSSPP